MIKKRLPGATTRRHAMVLISGNTLSLVVTAVGYPVLTRLYDDLAFGNFVLFQSIVVVLMRISSLNYSRALVIARSKNRFRNLLSVSFALNLVFSLLVLLLVLGSVPKALGINLDFRHAIWIPLSVLLGGMIETCLLAFNRSQQYRNISLIKVVERVGFQSSGIGLGWINLPLNGLIGGHIIAQALSLGISFVKVLGHIPQKWSSRFSKQTLARFIDFPVHSLPAVTLEQFSRHLPIFIIAWFLDQETTGQYGLAYRMLSLPESIVGAGVAQIFYQQLSHKYQRLLPVKNYIFRIWGGLFLVGIVPFTLVMFFGQPLFEFTFGEPWSQAGEIAQILSPMILLMFINTPTTATFTVFRKQHLGLIFNAIIFISRITTLTTGMIYWNLTSALEIFVMAEICLMIGYNILLLHVVKRWESNRDDVGPI